jgi:cell division protease FtsH
MNDESKKMLRRPLRIALILGILLVIGYFGYSWVAGYDQQFFRSGIVVPLSRKVHVSPPQALAHMGTYFPQFLPKLLAGIGYLLFISSLFVLQMAALFWFMSRGRTYVIYPGEYDVTFDDVRGQPAVVEATKDVVKLFQGFKDFRARGGYPPHGILFEGPPGTGKTLLGKAIAGSTSVPFLYSSGTSFSNMFVGIGNLRIASLFRRARRYSDQYGGAVIFIDELDAVGSRGGVSQQRSPFTDPTLPPEHREFWARRYASIHRYIMPGGFGMGAMLVNELLVQMDGLILPSRRFRHIRRLFQVKPRVPTYNILIIGATNMASALDPALLRPGRFDRKVHVGLPTGDGRKDIAQYYLGKVPHEDIDLEKLANATMHYSPARIKTLVNEALIIALQDGRDKLSYDDIYQAKLIDEIGLKQPVTYTPWEKESTALHEAGHAVVAWFLKPGEAVQVISIQKREEALGLVSTMDIEERFSKTRDEFLADIKVMLAGRVAEQLWYEEGQLTSGASSDLRNATLMATQMVAHSGMGSSLISAAAIPPWAGEETMKMLLRPGPLREDVDRILTTCSDEVERVLKSKTHAVEVLRDYLIVEEQITGDRFEQIMEALGEPRGGDQAAVRRPPKVLAPHRPRPADDPLGGNGQGDGEITVAENRGPDPETGAAPSSGDAGGDGSGDGSGAAD